MKRRSVKLFCCCIFAALFSFVLVPQSPAQLPPGELSLYPKAVVVSPGASIQFCALLSKDGYAQTPTSLRWHASEGTISDSGSYEAPTKAGTYFVKALLGKQKQASAQVIVRTGSTGQRPKTAARVSIIKSETKSPDFLTMKLKARVKVFGAKAHRLLLYAIDTKGQAKLLESKAVSDGKEVDFKVAYPSLETKKLRYVLQDVKGQTLAKHSRRAN